jgi:phage gp46-like protein
VTIFSWTLPPLTVEVDTSSSDVSEHDLLLGDRLVTGVLLSLFCDRRAEDDDPIPSGDGDRRGWWADEFLPVEGDKYGARLWLLDRAVRRADVPPRAEEFCREALAWMLEDLVAARIEIAAELGLVHGAAALLTAIEVFRPDGTSVGFRFSHIWDAAAGASPGEVTTP